MSHRDVLEIADRVVRWSELPEAKAVIFPGVAVFGGFKTDEKTYSTWFLASDRFPQECLKVTRAAKQMIADGVAKGLRADTFSIGTDERAKRWFKMLGLHEVEPGHYTT
jgi:hypothetical protein